MKRNNRPDGRVVEKCIRPTGHGTWRVDITRAAEGVPERVTRTFATLKLARRYRDRVAIALPPYLNRRKLSSPKP